MQADLSRHPPTRSRFTWQVWLGMALWLVGSLLPVLAQPLASPVGTDWAQSTPKLRLTPRMQYFKEAPNTPLTWQQALASNEWKPANPADMVSLRTATTMWMQVDIENSSTALQTRWVVVDYWALRDAQLFELDASRTRLLTHQRSGQDLAPADRALATERPAFVVSLEPGQRKHLLLRASDLHWLFMDVDAWDDAAYLQTQTKPSCHPL